MPENNQMLAEILDALHNGRDVPEGHLRWAAHHLGFDWTPTQSELKAKLIELGHISA